MTWVPTYLISVKKFEVFQMGFVAATPWLGAIVGNIIGGYLSDKVFDKRRKPVMLLTAASTIFTMYALIYSPGDPIVLAVDPYLTPPGPNRGGQGRRSARNRNYTTDPRWKV